MKTIKDTDVKAALDRLDRALTPAPVLAKQAVAAHSSRSEGVPWVNVTDTGSPLLNRDAVLAASQPNHAPNVAGIKRRGLLRRLLRRY